MLDYERLYRILFNGITDALGCLEKNAYGDARETMMKAQQAAEAYYIETEDEDGGAHVPVYVLPHDVYTGG